MTDSSRNLVVTLDERMLKMAVYRYSDLRTVFIGWSHTAADDVKGGTPADVAKLLACAIAEFGPSVLRFDGGLIWTAEKEKIAELFGGKAWSMNSEVAFLYTSKLSPGSNQNTLQSIVNSILVGRKDILRAMLESSSASGILTPGVDGDFAQFAFLHDADRQRFVQILGDVCQTMSVVVHTVPFERFELIDWYALAKGLS